MKIILASGSPRRKELLTQAGIEYEVIPADVDETIEEGTKPDDAVKQLSYRKAIAVAKENPGRIVLGADTVVAFDNVILGKPKDEEDAVRMLKMLSGRTHQVYTGVAIVWPDGTCENFAECTDVDMFDNSEEMIRAYVATKEPMDKAGAYGIQGLGTVLVSGIRGDYNNVVGLPLARVARVICEK